MYRRTFLLLAAGLGGTAIMPNLFTRAAETGTAFEVTLSEAEWRTRLTPAQFDVLRKHGTERAGSANTRADEPETASITMRRCHASTNNCHA